MKSKLLVDAPNNSLSSAPLDMAIVGVLNKPGGAGSLEHRKSQYEEVLGQFGSVKVNNEKPEAEASRLTNVNEVKENVVPDKEVMQDPVRKAAPKKARKNKTAYRKEPYWLP